MPSYGTLLEKTTKLPDTQVFNYAKETLKDLSNQNKPFVLTLMTLDTHYGTYRFADDVCERKYGQHNNIENVVSCSDKQINSFIEWLKLQDYYKDLHTQPRGQDRLCFCPIL